MKIISHRGFWQKPTEKNTLSAFKRSFDLGLGTETDLRDRNGRLAIAHDVKDVTDLYLEDVLELMNYKNLPLALNIKADGLAEYIKEIMVRYNHSNYFTFDMSIPDMLSHFRLDLKVYTGLSDILKTPVQLDKATGIWLDSFYSEWYTSETIDKYLELGISVCIVSSELHKRNPKEQWNVINNVSNLKSEKLLLCTDLPLEALDFFGDHS